MYFLLSRTQAEQLSKSTNKFHPTMYIELRSKDLNDVKIGVLGQAPAYPVPSLGFVFVSYSVG